jgi:SanA protein
MNKLKKILRFILFLFALGILVIWGVSIYIQQVTVSSIYEDIETLPNTHTVIVLGASVHSDGKLSPILQDRVDTALNLYKKGKVKRFLLSGDNRTDDYDEVSAMRNYLLDRCVPETIIFVDPAGLDTFDSMYRSMKVYEVPDAVVVTQNFHLPRTLFIAQNLGLNYIGFPAISRYYKTESSLIRREKLANVKAVFEILLDWVRRDQ